MLGIVPILELSRESATWSPSRNEFLYFGLNLCGTIVIFSGLQKTSEPFISGAFMCVIGIVCGWVFIHRMRKLKAGNVMSMNVTILLIFTLFLPTFFPMQVTTKPSALQMLLMLFMGALCFVPITLISRAIQVTKVSTFMLMGSLFLILKGMYEGFDQNEMDFFFILGAVCGLVGIAFVVRDYRMRTVIVNRKDNIPLISI